MRACFRLHPRTLLGWLMGLSLLGAGLPSLAWAACASTPAAAVGNVSGKSVQPSTTSDGVGFRVQSERWDPVLREQWALVVNCAHPDWPAIEFPSPALSKRSAGLIQTERPEAQGLFSSLPVVRAGDVVQLWGIQGDLHIEVAAMAEQSGGMGKTIRVRLMQRETLGPQIQEQFDAVVRGPHDVEMK